MEYTIAVDGSHEHVFTNPAGISYRIGCFSDAYGCLVHGTPTDEFTWFPGYRWCFCTCSQCRTHLGWFYHDGEKHFFGLVLAYLRREASLH